MSLPATSSKALYLRLLSHVWPYRRVFLLSILGMVVAAATDTSFAALMKWLVDGTFVQKDPTLMQWLPAAIVAITILRVVNRRVPPSFSAISTVQGSIIFAYPCKTSTPSFV